MNVAVLGGGHGAFTTAADLTLAGHRVRLWRRAALDLAAAREGIALTGDGREGLARMDLVTAQSRDRAS